MGFPRLMKGREFRDMGPRSRPGSRVMASLALVMVLASGMGVGISLMSAGPAIAQLPFFRQLLRPRTDEFPPSPLELMEADPLLPEFPLERSLTDAEKEELRSELDQLRLEGIQFIQAGNAVRAQERWYRELRLRRFLGLDEEIVAIGQVGAIASQRGQTEPLRIFVERLRAIGRGEEGSVPTRKDSPFVELTAVPNLESPRLEKLAVAFQQVQAPRLALVVYEELLGRDREAGDTDPIQRRLETVAEVHLAWFDYGPAATYYEELVALEAERLKQGGAIAVSEKAPEKAPILVPTARDLPPEILPPYRKTVAYLQQLANIYQRANQPEQAIATLQKLIATYRQLGLVRPIPALQVTVGDHYAGLGKGEEARSLYLKATALAQQIQQLGVARNALTHLVALYQQQPELRPSEDAIVQVSLAELDLARQAGDGYGMMAAYDRLGQWLRSQGQIDQARVAFEQGAILAGQLNHRQLHFQRQLKTLEQL